MRVNIESIMLFVPNLRGSKTRTKTLPIWKLRSNDYIKVVLEKYAQKIVLKWYKSHEGKIRIGRVFSIMYKDYVYDINVIIYPIRMYASYKHRYLYLFKYLYSYSLFSNIIRIWKGYCRVFDFVIDTP